MIDMVRSLMERLRRFDKSVRSLRSKRVSKIGIKEEARAIVDIYFREARERLVIGGLSPQQLSDLDANMQNLLEVTNKASVVNTYRSQIKGVERELMAIEKQVLS